MRSWNSTALILMLACAPFAPLHGKPAHRYAQFPAKGTPYADARASLLKHGLVTTHDRDAQWRLDRKFHELNCFTANPSVKAQRSVMCRALFLETDKDGWRIYAVVYVDPKDETVIDANYATPMEGLPAIPPPLPRDVPQIRGSYLKARATLRALGFRPARGHQPDDLAGAVCLDEHCKREGRLPEAQCSGSGQSYCNAYWISPGGRVLLVGTIDEYPRVYWVRWSTWKELHSDLD